MLNEAEIAMSPRNSVSEDEHEHGVSQLDESDDNITLAGDCIISPPLSRAYVCVCSRMCVSYFALSTHTDVLPLAAEMACEQAEMLAAMDEIGVMCDFAACLLGHYLK